MSFAAGYNVAKDVGNNIASGFREAKDSNAIESILSQAMSTGNQEDLNDAIGKIMSQVSPQNQKNAIDVLQNTYSNLEKKMKLQKDEQKEQRERQAAINAGIDPDLNPSVQKEQYKQNSYDKRANDIFGGNTSSNMQQPNNQTSNEMTTSNKRELKDLSKDELIKGLSLPGFKETFKGELDRRDHLEKLEQTAKIENKKEVSDSYKENNDYINKVYDQYEDGSGKEAKLDRMTQLDDSGELSDSGTINALESLGLKPEWLKNPANEEYNKLSLDLLGGGSLQADYGSRVLASEFKVSQQRIPTLSLTKEGRKQIIENYRAMLLPAKLKKERLQYYLDKAERTGEPLPHNLRGKILQDIKPQLDEAYDSFRQRNGRYKVKKGTSPDDASIEKYYFISNGNLKESKKMMKEDGYDIE